ncbi:MAG: hypothetical protein V3T30_00595 [Thermodesulfobacteriota bacterium]
MNILRLFSKRSATVIVAVFISTALVSCGGEKKEAPKVESKPATQAAKATKQPLPKGHPAPGGDGGGEAGGQMKLEQMPPSAHTVLKKAHKEVRLTEEVTSKWNTVKLLVTDNSATGTENVTVKVGEKKALKDGFALTVKAYVPDYAISGDYISTRSNEPKNPAILVELHKAGEVVASGWVFELLADYNSYSHIRYSLALAPTK